MYLFVDKLVFISLQRHSLQSVQNLVQLLMVVLIVIFAVLPQVQRFLFSFHKGVPGVREVQRLHHPQLAADAVQGLQASLDLFCLPLEQARRKDAELDVFPGLQQLC